jgi:hypothetical protein
MHAHISLDFMAFKVQKIDMAGALLNHASNYRNSVCGLECWVNAVANNDVAMRYIAHI